MNKVTLIGRLGNYPDVKEISGENGNNFKVCNNISIAVRRDKDNTDWINCKATGKTVEILEKYVKKGDMVGIEGRLQVESWEKDGKKNSKMVVNIQTIHLLPNSKGTESNTTESNTTESNSNVVPLKPEVVSDIPF